MTAAPVESPAWSRQRWWLAIALVLGLQAALVFLLERHSTGGRRNLVAVPLVHLPTEISLEKFAVTDPTVFVLPHPHGFSGEAWLNRLASLEYRPADWSEPPRALPLAVNRLGENFAEVIRANAAPEIETITPFAPAPGVPRLFSMDRPAAESTLRIEGPLAGRRLLLPPPLPAWESAGLLVNSVAQVLVDAQGRVISAVLLPPGGSLPAQQQADASALELAKAAQFEPAATEAPMLGTLIFRWQTLPLPATNSPAALP